MENSFNYWAEKWLESMKFNVKPTTHNEYKKLVQKLSTEIGEYELKEITPKIVQNVLDNMYLDGRAKSTINKKKYLIQQVYSFANLEGQEITNPCSFVRAAKLSPKSTRRSLTADEIQTVIKYRNHDIYGLYAFCLLFLGLRRSEMLALKWEDVDFSTGLIHIHSVVNFVNSKAYIDNILKNTKKERYSPMPKILMDELFLNSKGKQGFIFGKDEVTPLNENTHNRGWQRYKDLTGLNVTQHMFRHAYATMLFEANIDIKTAAQLLGHADERITMTIYTHLKKEKAAQKAMEPLNNFVNETFLLNHRL